MAKVPVSRSALDRYQFPLQLRAGPKCPGVKQLQFVRSQTQQALPTLPRDASHRLWIWPHAVAFKFLLVKLKRRTDTAAYLGTAQ